LLPSSATWGSVCLLQVVLYCFLLQIIEVREDLISGQGFSNTGSITGFAVNI
jgi:hypothetical protein